MQTATENQNSILLPFENGEIAQVSLSVYKAPKGQNRPVDAYVVTECEGDFTGSARRAAEAAYQLLQKRLPRLDQMVIGLDIQGISPGTSPVTGESGGLTFAVAIAGELLKERRAIAATGVISSSGDGSVSRVEGIAQKLTAAAENLPETGRILYPADNHDEIPDSVYALARDKNLTLHPVTTISEAIDEAYDLNLQDTKPQKSPAKFKFPLAAVGMFGLLATFAIYWMFNMPPDEPKTLPEPPETAVTKLADPVMPAKKQKADPEKKAENDPNPPPDTPVEVLKNEQPKLPVASEAPADVPDEAGVTAVPKPVTQKAAGTAETIKQAEPIKNMTQKAASLVPPADIEKKTLSDTTPEPKQTKQPKPTPVDSGFD